MINLPVKNGSLVVIKNLIVSVPSLQTYSNSRPASRLTAVTRTSFTTATPSPTTQAPSAGATTPRTAATRIRPITGISTTTGPCLGPTPITSLQERHTSCSLSEKISRRTRSSLKCNFIIYQETTRYEFYTVNK